MKTIKAIVCIFIFLPSFLVADTSRYCKAQLNESDNTYLQSLYTYLHANPELSFLEHKTAEKIAGELRSVGFDVTEKVGGTGVVAVFKNGTGPTVMLRMDMDALPVKEETNARYASKVTQEENGEEKFVMHACGHDMHMTNVVGASKLLIGIKNQWQGTLIVIAQPAEERGAGALAMIKDGLFKRFPRPDFAIAHHVDAGLEVGKVSIVEGFHTANVDSVDILVRGRGGHGARPHQTKDPVVIASQIVVALQTIVSREIDPLAPAVVTVGSFHAGTKHNIIPDEAKLQLTIRSYTNEVRDKVLNAIKRIAHGVGVAAGLDKDMLPEVTQPKSEYTPAGYNDPDLVARASSLWMKHFGADKVVEGEKSMGGEDFARYGQVDPKIPALLFRLGVVPKSKINSKHLPPLHSSKFLPDYKPAIETGVTAISTLALDLFGACGTEVN